MHAPNMFDTAGQTNKTSPIKHENKRNVLSCLIECLMTFKFYQTRFAEPRFLPRKMHQDFYLRVIFSSVNYGLILWGAYCNSDILDSLESCIVERLELFSIYRKIWHLMMVWSVQSG